MKYTPAVDQYLERYEVADGAGVLGIANEGGDITAFVRRADGTYGHCYGGPVYEPPEFTNVCARPDPLFHGRWVCDHKTDMTAAERATADAFARKVGWMPDPLGFDGPREGAE
jgi:hypothetical protein